VRSTSLFFPYISNFLLIIAYGVVPRNFVSIIITDSTTKNKENLIKSALSALNQFSMNFTANFNK